MQQDLLKEEILVLLITNFWRILMMFRFQGTQRLIWLCFLLWQFQFFWGLLALRILWPLQCIAYCFLMIFHLQPLPLLGGLR